jgi:exosortase K
MHNHDRTAVNRRINRLLGAMLTFLAMLVLKRHYSTAAADQLAWMLAPTARLTAWLTSARPVWEQGTGYVDFAQGVVIAPACAGINFMIMAFGLAAFSGLFRIRRLALLLAWLIFSLAGAYGLALTVNAVRIAISMALYQADVHTGWLTVARVHRLTGVGIYLAALGLFFKVLAPIISTYCARFDGQVRPARSDLPPWLPLGWYLLVAVGVPTANLLFRHPVAGYGEHCITVLLTGLALFAGSRLLGTCLNKPSNQDGERVAGPDAQSTHCGR